MAAFPSRNQEDFLTHWSKILTDDSIIKKLIAVDGCVAGNIVSFEVSGEREVGYWLGREYWGLGIATAALHAFLRYEPVRPLHAYVVADNAGSIRVLEKCGFVQSSRHRTYSSERGQDVEEVILTLHQPRG
jgi:RimJ/RimL family protein N-acetyltransferase